MVSGRTSPANVAVKVAHAIGQAQLCSSGGYLDHAPQTPFRILCALAHAPHYTAASVGCQIMIVSKEQILGSAREGTETADQLPRCVQAGWRHGPWSGQIVRALHRSASVLSLSLRLRWLSLLNTPSPEQEGLVANPKRKALTKRCKYVIVCWMLDAGCWMQYTGCWCSRTLSVWALGIAATTMPHNLADL